MSTDAEYLKKVIRENLLVELSTQFNGDKVCNDVVVKLRFKGDKNPFAMDVINLPEGG